MIARYVIEKSEKEDVSAARQLLTECDLLKIEDVLPFFPNFVTIDDFKVAENGSLCDMIHWSFGWGLRMLSVHPFKSTMNTLKL
eukprot:m.66237 g.66237  ORF g.66237 m.66237 type:complete len:84 (+) comp35369_c0_seq1:2431-2682(+)